ncbi:hypothetical protein Tco_0318115 [Tanacetum coccineum]
MIVPHHTLYPPVAGAALLTKGSAAEYPRQIRNLSLKEIAEAKGLCPVYYLWEKVQGAKGKIICRDWVVPVLTSWSHKDSSFWTEIYETTTCTCKKPTIPTRLFQGQVLEADLTTVKLDDVSRSCGTPRGDNSAEWDKDPGRWLAFEDEEGLRPLKSTLHSLTPSGEHTLFTGGDEKLEATVSPRR